MWGLRILWWGRIGKVLEFLGGALVIVDLIGPERFRILALRVRVRQRRLASLDASIFRFKIAAYGLSAILAAGWVYVMVAIVEGWIIGHNPDIFALLVPFALVIITVAISLLILAADDLLLWFARFLALGRHVNLWKWLSLVLVVIGFHFNLLAS
jgi:hypothetical protein